MGRGMNSYDDSVRYLTAQICMNGHVITSGIEISPEMRANFCATCGSATISACPSCQTPIRGVYHVPGFFSIADHYDAPNHCYNCGAVLPWTKAKLEAAKEHALELEGLNDADKTQLQGAIEDIAAG